MPAAYLRSIGNLLSWDQETHMPKGANDARSAQKEYLAGITHKEQTSPRFKKALSELIDLKTGDILIPQLSDEEKSAVKAWAKDLTQAEKLPVRFIERWTSVTSDATHAWAIARENDNFKEFESHLNKIVDLARERSELLEYKNHPYNALLDEYEPNATVDQLDALFADLKPFLIELTKTASKKTTPLPPGPYPIDAQTTFVTNLCQDMGLSPHHTRLDFAAHPFCMDIHPTDLRMTTHASPDTPIPNISAVLHEGGHCLYELGQPEKYYGTPLCAAISLGIHESQSRFWEVIIGQGRPFWEVYYPKLQETFSQLQNYPFEDFLNTLNKVEPSFIRVHADEVTYTLHVILRYELEKDLLTGSLSAKDIPDAWNAKMEEYLGITPPSPAKGCLQDIHWSAGLVGYFPTYALGNLYSAQIFAAFTKAHPDYVHQITSGDLHFIRDYLKENVHRHGRRYSAAELIENISGSPLSSTPYRQYLTQKYT